MPSREDVTRLLLAWEQGDPQALEALLPHVEKELRRKARQLLRHERADHTLQPTALVHEAFLKLIDQQQAHWHNRTQFFAVAARLMRWVLVDHARKHRAAKRGDGAIKVSLDHIAELKTEPDLDLLALDQALDGLVEESPRAARMVELRFFGGLTIEETAAVLGISTATIKLDWQMARAWLYSKLKGG